MKIYTIQEDTDKQILVGITCDGDCNPRASIKPNPATSDWMKHKTRDFCPECNPERLN